MKKIYTLLLLCSAVFGFAQVPQLMNYQGVLRRSNGDPIPDTIVTLRFKIFEGINTTATYSETQVGIGVNSQALFTTQIGKNAALPASWTSSPYYLRVYLIDGNSTEVELGGQQQLVSVPFALNATSPTVSISGGVLSVGGNTAAMPATAGSQTLSTVVNGSLAISNGNTVNVWPQLTGGGSTTVTPTANGFSVSSTAQSLVQPIIPPTYPAYAGMVPGLAQVFGTAPNQSIIVAPDITYNSNSGELVLSSRDNLVLNALFGIPVPPGPQLSSYSFSFPVVPLISFGNGVLQSGPSSNTLNLNSWLPWRRGTPTFTTDPVARLANITHSVGIGVDSPNSKLHVDGFTKLGESAPAIQVMTISATTANAVNGAITVALPSYLLAGASTALTTNKVIAVTVMVQTTNSSDWVPPGHTALSGAQFNWHMNSTNGIVITNSALATNILSAPVKITVTYIP